MTKLLDLHTRRTESKPSGTSALCPQGEAQPAQLTWKRKCFGKVSVSIAPQPFIRRHRSLTTGIAGLNCAARRWKRIHGCNMERSGIFGGLVGALDNRGKFQPYANEISGKGQLSRRHDFSRYAADVIHEVAWIAKRKYDNQGIFLTGTLPLDSDLGAWMLMAYSAYIVERVKNKFRKLFNEEFTMILVWENTKRNRPHVHVAVMSNNHEKLLRSMVEWHDWWFGILLDLTKQTGVNLFTKYVSSTNDKSYYSWYPFGEGCQSDAQMIEQDISQYLSKYLSKEKRSGSTNSAYHPSRWWSVDNQTRREGKQERVRVQIGGLPLHAIRLAQVQSSLSLESFVQKQFHFVNPVYLGFGGSITFTEAGEDLHALASFVRWLDAEGLPYVIEPG